MNDPPERTKGNISNLTVLEDSGLTKLGLTGLEYSPGGGADEESQVPLVYKLTALPEATLGSIELADGTAVALDADGVFELSLTDLGGLNFKPVADANGTSELEFTVTDTDGGVLTETISINVAAVNDAPRLTATQKSLSNGVEDTVYSITAADLLVGFSDIDSTTNPTLGDSLSVDNLVATGGTITKLADGNFEFTPLEDLNGEFTLNFNVVDGQGGSTVATTTFTLAARNDAPERSAGTVENLTVLEDASSTSLGLTDLAYTPGGGSDEAAQNLSYVVTEIPVGSLGAIATSDGKTIEAGDELTPTELQGPSFTAAANANGSALFRFTIADDGASTDNDGNNNRLVESININVISVNDAPELTGEKKKLADGTEDTVYPISAADLLVGYSDIDLTTNPSAGDVLSVDNLVATGGTITDLGEGNFEFTPVEDLNGSFTLTFNVVDGKGGITPATTTFTLEAVNDPPERTKGNISNLTVLEDSGLTKLGLTGLEYSPGWWSR